MSLAEHEKRHQSDRVSRLASLVDLRVRELNAKLLYPGAKPPLQPTISIAPKVGRANDFAIYDFTYLLGAKDKQKRDVFQAQMTLSIIFSLKDQESVDTGELESFGAIGVVEIAHPYVREMIHSLTFRMGLPPFVLDVAPPIEER